MKRPSSSDAHRPIVRVQVPARSLSGYVTFYYSVRTSGPLVDFLYPEWGNLRFSLDGTWRVRNDPRDPDEPASRALFGPTDRCGRIETSGGLAVGFGLTPLGWSRLIGTDASLMANRVCELRGELGVDPGELKDALMAAGGDIKVSSSIFEDVLRRHLSVQPPVPPVVLDVDRVLRAKPSSVDVFAEMVGVSERTLHRTCLRAYGFPPKRLMRRQRFLTTLGALREHPDSHVGTLLGESYFDHSHFNRDFRDFMGMTARVYGRTPRALMQAAAEAQVASGIPISFDLPDAPTP